MRERERERVANPDPPNVRTTIYLLSADAIIKNFFGKVQRRNKEIPLRPFEDGLQASCSRWSGDTAFFKKCE